ncbi:unnamed protein product [Lymnaea stagnalis]|uniref:Sorting nexin C-terminal domain-containing protein n=1 Tax=Lymnaea stagnalis TaxID=6523 RepID=A0AAV2HS55_LYMST
MFLRGVSGVVDRIKALPNIPQEVMSGFRGRDTPDDKLSRSKIQWDMDTIDFVSDFISEEEMNDSGNILDTTCAQLLDDLITDEDKELFLVSDVISDVKASEQAKEVYRQEIEKLLADIHTAQGSQTTDEASDLGFTVLELLVCGLEKKDHWVCRDRVVKSIQAVLGKALNRYLDSAISNLTSEPKVTHYLRLLRETVWPQGQLRSSSHPNKSKELRALTRSQAKRCLINFFPESIRLVIGRNDFEDMIDTFLNSIESEQLNRHLLYQILDYLMEQLFPEMVSQEFLHNLCFKFRTDQPL